TNTLRPSIRPSTCVLLSRRPENGGLEFHATTSSVLLTQTQFVPSAWHVSPTGLPAQLCQHTLVMSPKIIGAPVGTAVAGRGTAVPAFGTILTLEPSTEVQLQFGLLGRPKSVKFW